MSAHSFNQQQLQAIATKAKFQPATMAVMRRVSQKQQQRQFKVAFNKTPTKWIREYRVALGLEWMEKDYSVKATAKELHYASDSHFIHDFKKVYSQSPYKMLRSKLGI